MKGVHEPLEVAKKPSSVVRYFVRTVCELIRLKSAIWEWSRMPLFAVRVLAVFLEGLEMIVIGLLRKRAQGSGFGSVSGSVMESSSWKCLALPELLMCKYLKHAAWFGPRSALVSCMGMPRSEITAREKDCLRMEGKVGP